MELALAAYRAQTSVIEYIKQSLSIGGKPAETRVLAPEAMPAVAPPPVPPVTEARAPIEPAPAQPPPAEPPAAAPAAEPQPAPTRPLSPARVETKTRKPRVPSALKIGVPRGFYRILEVAEQLHAGRTSVVAETGAERGHSYVVAMSDWLKSNGFGELDATTRFQLNTIGRDAAAVRRWFRTLPPGTYDDKTLPYTVMRDWQKYIKQNNGIPPAEGGSPEVGGPEPAPGPTSSAAEPAGGAVPETTDNADTTLYFGPSGIERRSFSAITGVPPGATLRKSAVDLEPEPSKQATSYDNFTSVDFDHLNSYDSRKLRQFTEKMVNLVGADREALADLGEADIALAIRKIRGNEGGDVPPTAAALARMGVIIDPKVHKLRREYIERYSDVRKWADV